VIADPEKFGVTLPELAPGKHLKTIILQSGMDVRLAARLAGLDAADMKRLNAAYRRNRMIATLPYALTMPADRVDRFQVAAQTVPVALWNDWREQRAARTSGLASWAAEVGVPVAVLALANGVEESTTVGPTTRLLLPGHEIEIAEAMPRAPTYVVRSGDTLAGIAQRQRMPLAQIKKLNPTLEGKSLHPGDRVHIGAHDAD
jgi:membrane-bound lytic murein transglycosylase D